MPKKLRLKKRVEVVAGVQWTGFNLLEVQMFLGIDEGFPKTEAHHFMLLAAQDRCRAEGLKIPYKESFNTAHIGDWVVLHSNATFGVYPDKNLRYEYDILEGYVNG